jgi:hypothetical protein
MDWLKDSRQREHQAQLLERRATGRGGSRTAGRCGHGNASDLVHGDSLQIFEFFSLFLLSVGYYVRLHPLQSLFFPMVFVPVLWLTACI